MDAAIAAQLQNEEWSRADSAGASSSRPSAGTSSSRPSAGTSRLPTDGKWSLPPDALRECGRVCDPSLEVSDPAPDARAMFLTFNEALFWGRLSGVELRWSKSMTRCAGLCAYEGKGGLCSVRLSEPLLQLRPRSDLINTLIHEMIHAWEFVAARGGSHDAHGAEFLRIARALNEALGCSVTVFHTFNNEVALYQRHWWQCGGPCRSKAPFFGIVKRAMNRPPGPSDPWFAQHKATCGGVYTKVKEPSAQEVAAKKLAGKRAAKERAVDKAEVEARKHSRGTPPLDAYFGRPAAVGGSSARAPSGGGEEVVELLDDDEEVAAASGAGAGSGTAEAVELLSEEEEDSSEDVILVSPSRASRPADMAYLDPSVE